MTEASRYQRWIPARRVGPRTRPGRLGLAVLALAWAGCGGGQEVRPAQPLPEAPAEPESQDSASEWDDVEKPPTDDEIRIAAIEKAVRETRAAQHRCWEIAAADDFRLAGTIVLAFTFGAEPEQPTVEVVSDGPGDPVLTGCVLEVFGKYRWPAVFEVGARVELPFAFQAPGAQYTVHRDLVAPTPLGQGSARVLLDTRSTGNKAVALTLLELAPGTEVALHRHTAVEVLYIVGGTGTVWGLRGEKSGAKVGPGTGLYLPAGRAHAFRVTGEQPVYAVQVYAPGGPEQRFEDPQNTAGTTPVPPSRSRRGPRPLVVTEPARFAIAGGRGSVAIYFDEASTGNPAAYLGVLTAEPGMVVPEHTHDASTEVLYILAGTGTMTIGADTYDVEPGLAVQIPPGVRHSFTNGGTTLRAVQLYTPAGPEQRFKRAAKK